MKQHHFKKTRLLSFLLAGAALLSVGSYTVTAVPSPVTAVEVVQAAEDAKELTLTEVAPEGTSPRDDGYIEQTATDIPENQTMLLRAQIVATAEAQLGTPYVYSGAYPGGFDCSGLVYYTYGRYGYHLTRCADTQLLNDGTPVYDQLQPGDLVFFRDPGSPWAASHVGIYVGEGLMIHAASDGIRYDAVFGDYYGSRYVGAKRIIQDK